MSLKDKNISDYNYEKFFELSLDLTCIISLDGHLKKINCRFTEVLLFEEEELLAQPFWHFVAEVDRAATKSAWGKLVNGQPMVNFENHCICKDGSHKLIEWTAVLGNDTGLAYAVGRDITAKRENQEEFLETILENIPDMIFVKDALELRFVRFNKAGEELLGRSREELLGKNDYDFFSKQDADHFTSNDRKVFAQRGPLEIPREPLETKYKGRRILHTKKIPIFDSKGEPAFLIGISEDVTEKLQAQEANKLAFEEQVARQETERSLKERDEFISIASHELKSPLSSLKLQAQIFRRNANRNPENAYSKERVDKLVDLTEKQVTRLVRLVDDMLDVSRIRTGRLSMEWTEFDLCELVRDVLERTRTQFENAQLKLPEFFTSCDQLQVEWDRIRIEQVLVNLLTNSIRYGEGKPVEVHLEKRGHSAHFWVKDQGKGIPADMLELIFDRFKRALAYNEATGLGLGLFISKQIVSAHKGRIWAESQEQKGSLFHVEIPLKPNS